MEMGCRWDFTYEILPQMAIATLNTILAAGVGYAIALIVGLFFLLAQRTPSMWINCKRLDSSFFFQLVSKYKANI